MTSPNIPRVIEYLRAHPNGVLGWQIAGHLDSTNDSAHQSLLLLQKRGQAVLAKVGKTNADCVWMLTKADGDTLFRAMETLHGMQSAARKKLIERVAEVV